MVMQSVYLYDKNPDDSQGGAWDSVEDEPAVFADRWQIIWLCRAAQLLIDEFGIEGGVSMDPQKHIPVAAGVGRWQLGCSGSAGRHVSVVSSGAFPGGTSSAA